MKAIKTFVDNSKIEETVNLLNKAFVYAGESEEDFKEVAKEALEKFFETYLAFGLSGTEKWTLTEGKKRYGGTVWEDHENLTIGVDYEKLQGKTSQQRMTALAQIIEEMTRTFYRASMYRYLKFKDAKSNGNENVDGLIDAYERFLGKQIAPHFYDCMRSSWNYAEAEILTRFFAYATGEEEFNKVGDRLSQMAEKEDELFDMESDDAEYRSFAFFPEELYRDVVVVSVENRLIADMMNITTAMAQNLDENSLFYITPEGIRHINENLRGNRKKINNEYTDTSDESLQIGKLILKLSDQFNEEIYLDYVVGIILAGSKMHPQNTTEVLRSVLGARSKGESLEEFSRKVYAIAEQRRNLTEDENLASIYTSIITAHKIVAGDMSEFELDELLEAERRARENGVDENDEFDEDYFDDEFDDGYDDYDDEDEDDGNGI